MDYAYISDPADGRIYLSGSVQGKRVINLYNQYLNETQSGGHVGPCVFNTQTQQCRKGKKGSKKCQLVKGNCRVRRSPRLKKLYKKNRKNKNSSGHVPVRRSPRLNKKKQVKVANKTKKIMTVGKVKKSAKNISENITFSIIELNGETAINSPCCIPGYKGSVVFNDNVILAKEYVTKDGGFKIDPVGWWMSEKFDGYRAIWNGQYFKSRSHRRFSVPSWFSAMMPPSIPLDGELWLGRSNFESCGMFRKKRPTRKDKIDEWSNEWKKAGVVFKVFDIPNINKPFEERMTALKKLIKDRRVCLRLLMKEEKMKGVKFPIQYTKQILVKSHKQVKTVFDKVVSAGGEGIMLREPGSMYETKRSSTLLKYKEMADTECRIIDYKPGTGKYTGMLGAFICELVSDPSIKFKISGMNDCVRKNYNKSGSKHLHPLGTIITFKYNGFTKRGIPRHPQYMRKRQDL